MNFGFQSMMAYKSKETKIYRLVKGGYTRMVPIDNRHLFFEKLHTGINLFTGAGFSVLKDSSGNGLPVASDLGTDLCKKFKKNEAYAIDLERLSSVLKRNCKKEFQNYLREKYTINDYNDLYNVLNKINLSSIITTNIDNLVPAVMDRSKRYYLNTVSYYGPAKRDGSAVQYIPLHGDVLDPESELYFGKFELCNVSNQNRGLFSMMQSELLKKPTLFWGYGFHDGGVSGIIDQVLSEGRQDIWVQLCPGKDDIDFFRDLGCNVIIADTESLLKEIDENIPDEIGDVITSKSTENTFWNKYAIPTINQVESMPIRDFYEKGKTHWYYVLTERAYLTKFVNKIIDASIENKNVIVVGIPFGGKTTLLMQVACRINKPTYFLSDLNDAKAKLICNNAIRDNDEYIILVDNCSEDMIAYRRLAECANIRTIATSDDFMYESSKHILERVSYKKIDIPDLEINEAQRIYENIPEDLRMDHFIYKQRDNEKFSILELITGNVKNIISQDKVEKSLEKIKSQNKEAFELILLTAYLTYHKSALSMDILVGYYGISDVNLIQEKIKLVRTYLAEMNIEIDDAYDQDYFSLRSALFAQYTHEVACNRFKSEYGRIIKKFIHEVSPCYIYKDYVFKRRAYDASLFLNVFEKDADDVYMDVYKNDPSAYTLQQWALYKAHTGRFSEAFSDIDKAIHLQPNNFSVRNARAIILFEANKDKNTDEAKESLQEAMRILEECFLSDKRKVYHAQKYAEFALEYQKKYKDDKYIEQAYCWLEELICKEESMSRKTKKLFSAIKEKR